VLAVDRIAAIEKSLDTSESVSVADLSRFFEVTEETIRRDLDKIVARDNLVVRVHGGAFRQKPFDHEAPYQLRENLLVAEKERMARRSSAVLERGDTIMLDSSTSALYLAKQLKGLELGLTVITNSLRIAMELSDCTQTNLVLIGGTYRQASRSFVGYAASATLSQLHADKALVSCSGLSERFGLTDNNESEAQIRRLMLENSHRKFLLVDSDKFGRCKNYHIADLEGVETLFTDKLPDTGIIRVLSGENVSLELC
jgi:DeoR/GlpR family transcriptional regulator of sugar metabolism